MGISPSSYDILNQRFSDLGDLKIYLNSMGEGLSKEALEELEKLKQSQQNNNSNQRARTSQSQRRKLTGEFSSGTAKIVPITTEEENKLNELESNASSNQRNIV